jgi:hypothetical protein
MPYEKFVPGVDPAVKAWLQMRDTSRRARLKSGDSTCTLKQTPYKYYNNWIDSLFRLTSEEIQNLLKSDSSQLFRAKIPILPPLDATLQLPPLDARNFDLTNEEASSVILDRILRERTLVFMEQLCSRLDFNINLRFGPHKRSMLQVACLYGDVDKVRFLLEHGASVNIIDVRGMTCMHLCIHPIEEMKHSIEIMTLLCSYRAHINVLDHCQRTPLHYACIIQSIILVEFLLKKNADISLCDQNNKMPSQYTSNVS